MFETAQQFIDFICKRTKTSRTHNDFLALMDRLGNPQLALKCIHVAGTNGKGSTTNYLRSILQAHGYKVGSFTSPHLVVHNDRIRINDVNIPDDRLLELGNRFMWAIEEYDLSMFQIDMLLSVYYFLEEQVDYVVYEVGMGGRKDPTNIIKPLVSVITNIGMDHMAILGDTLDKIAFEKAGIIKDEVKCFTAETKKICLEVFDKQAEEKHTEAIKVRAPKGEIKDDHIHFSYLDYDIKLPTMALYQVKNAALALRTADYLSKNRIIELDRKDIITGLENTNWDGRFEKVNDKPLVILDGAHNEHGIRAQESSLPYLKKPLCIVVSILKDKQYNKMIGILRKYADELIVTHFDYYRTTPLENIDSKGATIIPEYKDAIKYALDKYPDGTILITGSLYFVSEVRNMFVK